MIPPSIVTAITQEAYIALGGAELCPGAVAYFVSYADGVQGVFERGRDGFYCAAISNETECFFTEAEAVAWCYPRLASMQKESAT